VAANALQLEVDRRRVGLFWANFVLRMRTAILRFRSKLWHRH